jgi:hypothetical protein
MRSGKGKAIIFGIAAYAVVFVLLGIFVNSGFYIPLVAVAFIRPLLREAGALMDRDEWQVSVSHRSSHIAFLLAMALASALFVKQAIVDAEEPAYELSLLLFVPLLVKFAAWQLTSRGRRRCALSIGFAIGGVWLLFTALEGQLSPEFAVGGLPLLATLLALKWEKVGGAILLAIGGFAIYFLGARLSLIVVLLLPTPLILAGTLLLVGGGKDMEMEETGEETACEPQP